MRKKYFIAFGKTLTAGLIIAAVVVQLRHGLQSQAGFQPTNFFSYFTIQSNLLAAAILLVAALTLVRGDRDRQLDYLRGGATLYMLVTGIIYIALLSGADVQTPLPWVNTVLHYLAPFVLLLDWVTDPPSRPIRIKTGLLWLAYPLAWFIYTLVRGPMAAHWYPYDFINPDKLGYGHVFLNSLFLAVGMGLLAAVVARLSSWPAKRSRRA